MNPWGGGGGDMLGNTEAIVEAAGERFGRVDGLVNVAAMTTRASLFKDTPEHFDRMMAHNVRAHFLIQAAARLMIANGTGGSIVNVGSTSGHGGQSKISAYSISKGAVLTMTRELGVRPHASRDPGQPGQPRVDGDRLRAPHADGTGRGTGELARAAAPTRPLGRLVQPWEVANVIAFCLSPESGVLTGNVIDVDQSVQGAGDPPIPDISGTAAP